MVAPVVAAKLASKGGGAMKGGKGGGGGGGGGSDMGGGVKDISGFAQEIGKGVTNLLEGIAEMATDMGAGSSKGAAQENHNSKSPNLKGMIPKPEIPMEIPGMKKGKGMKLG